MNSLNEFIYPEFTANQVLTHEQLNILQRYLANQDHLTRAKLIGTGIAQGLSFEVNNSKSAPFIQVNGGYGVCSEGFFIGLDTQKFAQFRHYSADKNAPEAADIEASWAKKDVLQLVEKGGSKLSFTKLKDYVVVLFLERSERQLDSCLVTDCNNTGKNIYYQPQVLLVNKADLIAMPDVIGVEPFLLEVPRFHTKLSLTELENSKQINEVYQHLILDFVKNDLNHEKVAKAADYLEVLLKDFAGFQLFDQFRFFAEKLIEKGDFNQYSYDLLKDFVTAYNELVSAAFGYKTEFLPATEHPRYLMLGALDQDYRYRHHYRLAPNLSNQSARLEALQLLSARLHFIVTSEKAEPLKGITIRPSHGAHKPLGSRAIPFYLNPEIFYVWDNQICQADQIDINPEKYEKFDYFDEDYEICSLLRIEGHLGLHKQEAVESLSKQRQAHNLEFDISYLDFTSEDKYTHFTKFAGLYPGMEHLAGVKKGGTFILVCDEKEQVIADFSMHGQIPCCREVELVTHGTVRGVVRDETGAPYSNGTVELVNTKTKQGETRKLPRDGSFAFNAVPAGHYEMVAVVEVKAGVTEKQGVEFDLEAGETESRDILIPRPTDKPKVANLQVTVQNNSATPVPKAKVTINPGNQVRTTNSAGAVNYTNLPVGTYSVMVDPAKSNQPELQAKTASATVNPQVKNGVQVRLSPKPKPALTTLQIQVVDQANSKTKINTAKVTVKPFKGLHTKEKVLLKANSKGIYSFTSLTPGAYTVTVEAEGYTTKNQTISVTTTGKNQHPIALVKKKTQRGAVIDQPVKEIKNVEFTEVQKELIKKKRNSFVVNPLRF